MTKHEDTICAIFNYPKFRFKQYSLAGGAFVLFESRIQPVFVTLFSADFFSVLVIMITLHVQTKS